MSPITFALVIAGLISVYMLLQSTGTPRKSKPQHASSAEVAEMETKLARMTRRLEDLETILAEHSARN